MSMDEGVSRRVRRVHQDSDEDDDFFASFRKNIEEAKTAKEEESLAPSGPAPGTTVSNLAEDIRKKLQQQLIDGMFKYAEQKYGRKKASEKEAEKSTVKEDYELYLRSLKAKVKQANDKLQAVLRQRKEIEKKVDDAQKDADTVGGKLSKAEEEKENAANENRDPVLPKEFIVPQRTKRLGASLGALVMKASTQDWGAALAAFASSRKGTKATGKADWGVKRDKTAVLLKVGQTSSSKPKEEPEKKADTAETTS